MAKILIALVLSATVFTSNAANIFKWTDANGRVHYGDRPQAGAVKKLATPAGTGPAPTPTASTSPALPNPAADPSVPGAPDSSAPNVAAAATDGSAGADTGGPSLASGGGASGGGASGGGASGGGASGMSAPPSSGRSDATAGTTGRSDATAGTAGTGGTAGGRALSPLAPPPPPPPPPGSGLPPTPTNVAIPCGTEAPGVPSTHVGPQLCFTDLTAAPRRGWNTADPKRGAVITLYGLGFGTTRRNSYVSVNGLALKASKDYFEWGVQAVNPYLQRITVWLNSSIISGPGKIFVVSGGRASNQLDFHVNDGRIVFVDHSNPAPGNGKFSTPWADPSAMVSDLKPGDVVYFRGGFYDQVYADLGANFYLRGLNGTKSKPIAFVGYPGERAIFDSIVNASTARRGLQTNVRTEIDYFTIAKIEMNGQYGGIRMDADFNRVVECDCNAIKVNKHGTAAITTQGSGIELLGNVIHGGRSGSKLDHAVYVSGCPHLKGADVAWNYTFDNQYAAGTQLVANHQDSRCLSSYSVKQHMFRSNYVDCSTGDPGSGIKIFDLSWDANEAQEPEPALVFRNIIKGCGNPKYFSVSIGHNNGHAEFDENTILNGDYFGFFLGSKKDSLRLSTKVTNNTIQMKPGSRGAIHQFGDTSKNTISGNN
jgi:hypothetical protein